jgi:hypothetical protein
MSPGDRINALERLRKEVEESIREQIEYAAALRRYGADAEADAEARRGVLEERIALLDYLIDREVRS